MSEIDKPANQSPDESGKPADAAPASTEGTAWSGTSAAPVWQPAGDPTASPGTAASSPAAEHRPDESAAAYERPTTGDPAGVFQPPASQDAGGAFNQPATGNPVEANERTVWQRPADPAAPAGEPATPLGAAGAPGVPSGSHGEPVPQIQPEQPVYPGYVAGQAGAYQVPPTGQAWTPPASNPKKVPTAVKFVAGGVAAVLLALCSGVTGAVLATAFADKGSFSLPVSTDTAPIVDRSTLSGVAAKTQPSVVNIATGSGEGSGVILSEDGYILTNNHVVESASGTVTVTLSNGKKVKAKVVGTDPRTDLAVIKADATGLTKATLGDSNRVAVGDTVLAIGSPLGLQGSVTSGIISAKDRTIQAGQTSTSLSGLLQTDAPINPGNSGGALVNTNGDVIGINTAIATSGGGEGNIGVGFAIPSNKAKQVAEQLINGQKVSHPFLGVSVTAEDTGGAKIGTISPNSPAAAAGLKEGDVITKFGDRVVNDSDDLVSAVQSGTVGQKVTVEFIRNGETQTATVTLGEAS